MSPARMVVLVVLSLTACKGEPGQQGAQGPMGLQGLQGPKGDPGAPGQTVKLPHLIVAATGEDLGLRTQGTCAWSDDLQGEVCYNTGRTVRIFYTTLDCSGSAYLETCFGVQNLLFISHIGDVVETHCDSGMRITPQSTWTPGRGCAPEPTAQRTLLPLTKTGRVRADYSVAELRIDLR